MSWQSDVWEADLRDGERCTPLLPGQPVCVFPDAGTRVLRHGVFGGRRPHDAHPHRRVHRASHHVSCVCVHTVCIQECVSPLGYLSSVVCFCSSWVGSGIKIHPNVNNWGFNKTQTYGFCLLFPESIKVLALVFQDLLGRSDLIYHVFHFCNTSTNEGGKSILLFIDLLIWHLNVARIKEHFCPWNVFWGGFSSPKKSFVMNLNRWAESEWMKCTINTHNTHPTPTQRAYSEVHFLVDLMAPTFIGGHGDHVWSNTIVTWVTRSRSRGFSVTHLWSNLQVLLGLRCSRTPVPPRP